RLDGYRLPGFADHGDRPADGYLPRRDGDLQEDAARLGLDLLRRLVGVDREERLALLDAVTLRLQPLDDRARLHPLPEARQLHLAAHERAPVRFTAASTSAICGMTNCSIAGANASGANFAPTRSIGASSQSN